MDRVYDVNPTIQERVNNFWPLRHDRVKKLFNLVVFPERKRKYHQRQTMRNHSKGGADKIKSIKLAKNYKSRVLQL